MKLSQNTTSSLCVCVSPIFFIVMILCIIWMRVTWYTNFFLAVYVKRCWVCFFCLLSFFFKTTTLFFHCLSCVFFSSFFLPLCAQFLCLHIFINAATWRRHRPRHMNLLSSLCAIQRVCSGKINPVRNFNFLSRWMDVNLVPIPTISSHVKMNIDDTHR